MSAILLDTCAVMWMAAGVRLSAEAELAIQAAAAREQVYVSAVTGWELGSQYAKGRMRVADTMGGITGWYADFMTRPGLVAAPLTAEIALHSAILPELDHRDPADRFLLATARAMNVPIVTRDRVMLRYAEAGHVRCIAC